ncbi:MAG: hypothetical protein A3F82_07720 [Deltaproteobacteria bacterium RIFCSPLOWO2_12_FULL_44_12]|nr:MAG: hypothetical protein A2712_10555 [Deltaproteobacteria bacterium RIFCSPHIGHO2_01_FULL_43_49]OGQ15548.1 MAG: hypothetical protein A3D22_11085 [Deltaproteobacteria bacterium RIFCSPHIGHO2_02_FULL_44_53]OGQ28490.1 MAG: hypothetical protein A3D98_03270 [Deltaproteobacteria bacterium RIFCSPHIGHO2_12_FULL_44_21]OGQ32354.1 MAG: hypothetical protein A2979_00930 [Deltaproteobacteria bacterium RIFCSPLOWO2_01_FULL_45_74]OGQ43996.1 MAG: hypothetical protein A3I70_04830 [Deltaproteobacteria bacterium 
MLPAHYNKKESSYFCRFTFGQFFTILVLEIFTLFFVFYLGARYGDELLSVKRVPQTAIAEESGFPKLAMTNPNVVATTQDPEIKALAKDLLEQAPTADLKQRVQEMLQESAARKESLPKTKKPVEFKAAPKPEEKPEGVAKERPVIIVGTPPTEPLPKKREPVIQTTPTAKPFSIQVGAYPNVDEAHTMVDRWKAKGYPAYLVSADIPNRGRWYRVRLGGFESKEDAQDFIDKLQGNEEVEAFVVTNE